MKGRLVDARFVDVEGSRVRAGDLSWEGEEIAGEATGSAEVELAGRSDFVLPGLVSATSELVMTLLPAPTDDPVVLSRLRAALDLEAIRAGARRAAMEAALAGVTLVCDLHRGPAGAGALDAIAAGVEDVGIRAALAIDVGRDDSSAKAALAETLALHEKHAAGTRIRALLGIADPSAVGDSIGRLVSETRRHEMAAHLVFGGDAASRRRLAERAAIRPGSIAVLATSLDVEERALVRDLGAWAVVRPSADAARGETIPWIPRRTAVGAAGAAIDPLRERRVAMQRRTPPADAASGWSLIARGWDLAADLFDLPFGRFSTDAPADFVVFQRNPSDANPESIGTLPVRHVVVAGEAIVREGRPTRVDAEAVRREAVERARRIWKKAGLGDA